MLRRADNVKQAEDAARVNYELRNHRLLSIQFDLEPSSFRIRLHLLAV